ncbi:NAD(P)/FAD-dependent oxidoreductase [Microcystis aeruginosa]|uniref:Genome sequencing data, contig C313 n=1 Tax=Microcystis aeruginosa PCC 9443 TaxID=1160281 RepID=I4G4P1_MICAE|nr:tryptophan 7-halogenase [Microcystis aeruginosa]CCI02902.1 Genome sequencing data, contig C313 [Microcystis aeruginosa PCC 9443]
MNTTQALHYDVVIMGAGFAGLCQARHLMLKIPNIKVALVDPRPEQRTDKDLKIGESTIEIAALFLAKELGLHDYLIENHAPKQGLNFHWPKNPAKTETIDDYYHAGSNRQVPIPSFQINRSKFEQDLLKMDKAMGINFYNGQVVDVDLTPGDAIKTVKIKVGDERMELQAKHVIDAAGRKFIIGRKTDNLLFGQENLMGLNTGSAWVRVKNVDRTIFHSGYDPLNASTSHYYSTNHYFGEGHWLWMIPIDTQTMELSIGMIHHHDVIDSTQVNSWEKFHNFLQNNHQILANIIDSGEAVDFHYYPQISDKRNPLFSPDNWYVLGDTDYIFDAFYSYGTTTIALAIEGITEIVRAKLAGEESAEQKRAAYNEFNLAYSRIVNRLYWGHAKQLGQASVMSWRIYFEYMWWFGVQVPMYVGKWHLDLTYIPIFLKTLNSNIDGLFADLNEQFTELADKDVNIGLMDCYRGDQLFKGYHTLKHFDDFLENTKFEPRRCNVFAGLKATCFYAALWYALFQWKGFGIQGCLHPHHIYHFLRLLGLSGQATIGELIYKFKTKGLPANSEIEAMRQEFKTYQYQPKLQPWLAEATNS